jgi:glucose/arabinose dehydrogenase
MRVAVVLAIALGAAIQALSAAGSSSSEHLVLVGRFESPVFATAPAGARGTLYVVEQPGRVVVVANGHVRPTPFLDIRSKVQSGGEQGLLSLAFDPRYATNHLFYVDYTDLNGNTRVVRYRSNGVTADPSSGKQLLFVKDFAPNHNGGQLTFGPDGRLYWGNGDGGGGGDPEDNGQSLARPFAKIESLDVRSAQVRWKLVGFGLRNPWRFSFDRQTGDLYIGDVGQGNWEEIDFLRHGAATPVNFGWRHFEGTHVYDQSVPLLTAGPYVAPIFEYSHSQGCSVTGGYVYRGHGVPAATGRYFFGDYCSGTIWSLKVVNGKATAVRREPFKVAGLSSFGQDAAGELYLMSVDKGGLYRLAG